MNSDRRSLPSEPAIGVVCGGNSAEAEVSRSTGNGIAEALRDHFRHVHLLELDASLPRQLAVLDIGVVFPAAHGPPGEDGTLQGFLDIIGMPYVGSGVRASACAMDKVVSKRLFADAGLPVLDDLVLLRDAAPPTQLARQVVGQFGGDVVIKPAGQGSALGVQLLQDAAAVAPAIEAAFEFDERLLAERRIHGREITVAILERDDTVTALPVIEIRTPDNTWYDYRHRYTRGLSEHICPAPLPTAMLDTLTACAETAHRALGCRDLSRADFVVTDDQVWLLEVNTMPGMTPTSLYPDAAAAAGIDFPTLVGELVRRAWQRGSN